MQSHGTTVRAAGNNDWPPASVSPGRIFACILRRQNSSTRVGGRGWIRIWPSPSRHLELVRIPSSSLPDEGSRPRLIPEKEVHWFAPRPGFAQDPGTRRCLVESRVGHLGDIRPRIWVFNDSRRDGGGIRVAGRRGEGV